MDIVIATRNKGKVEQIAAMVPDPRMRLLSLEDLSIEGNVFENGKTAVENAELKSWHAWRHPAAQDKWVIAEDTCLYIHALGGLPGVDTAYWGGNKELDLKLDSEALMEFAIEQVRMIPPEERDAHWETVALLRSPRGHAELFVGRASGIMLAEPRGKMQQGMPYSPIFEREGAGKTWAELAQISLEEENKWSHRGEAFRALFAYLQNHIDD